MTARVLLLNIFCFSLISLSAGEFYTSGNEDIDRVRKELDQKPTDGDSYRERTILMYNWMGALQQQGADLRPFFEVDTDRKNLEPIVNRAKGEELKSAQAKIGKIIDTGFGVLDEIQRTLVEEGPMFEVFESDGKDFPEGGDMEAEWTGFQGNIHNTGYSEAPGPRYGRQAWKFPVGLGWYCKPAVEDGRVYVASPGMYATSFCLDLETGEEIWKSTQEHPIFGIYKFPAIASTPVIQGDRIILREINSHGGNEGQAKNLVYVDKATGKTLARKYVHAVE